MRDIMPHQPPPTLSMEFPRFRGRGMISPDRAVGARVMRAPYPGLTCDGEAAFGIAAALSGAYSGSVAGAATLFAGSGDRGRGRE